MAGDWTQDRIGSALAGRNPTVLARLPESFAVMGDTQFLPGYCVLLVDDPTIDHLTDLPSSRRARFLGSMGRLGEAVQRACTDLDVRFRRVNYEILGNTDTYLHAHVFARYGWEPEVRVGGPVWGYEPSEFYGEAAALGPRPTARRTTRAHRDIPAGRRRLSTSDGPTRCRSSVTVPGNWCLSRSGAPRTLPRRHCNCVSSSSSGFVSAETQPGPVWIGLVTQGGRVLLRCGPAGCPARH